MDKGKVGIIAAGLVHCFYRLIVFGCGVACDFTTRVLNSKSCHATAEVLFAASFRLILPSQDHQTPCCQQKIYWPARA